MFISSLLTPILIGKVNIKWLMDCLYLIKCYWNGDFWY
jgi:hypothetical protein